MRAARSGASVVVFDKAPYGRDKVCGDGLTPRAVGAMEELKIDMAGAHPIRGLRMIAGKQVRELDWPTTDRFPNHGAVWPRRRLDAALIDAAAEVRRRGGLGDRGDAGDRRTAGSSVSKPAAGGSMPR